MLWWLQILFDGNKLIVFHKCTVLYAYNVSLRIQTSAFLEIHLNRMPDNILYRVLVVNTNDGRALMDPDV